MNRFFYGFIAFLFLFLSIYPFSNVFADNDLVITGTPSPVQGDITDDQLTDILVSGITADLVSQGYEIDFSASDGDWDNFKNSVLDIIFDQASSGTGFIGEIYNSALYHNLIDEDFTIWYPDTSDGTVLPGLSKRSIYRNLSDGLVNNILEHRSDGGSTPTPSPDPNYNDILNVINGSGTEILSKYDSLGLWIDGFSHNSYVQYLQVNNDQASISFSGRQIQTSEILTINIYSSNGVYNFTVSSIPVQHCNQTAIVQNAAITYTTICYSDNNNIGVINSQNRQVVSRTRSGSLSQILYYISNNFKNVNIYVDDVPWSIISNPTLPTINIYPGYVLQGTDYPMQYYFPEPPQFDYQRMIDIIKHALLQYGVIQWEDIADVFVDVNGQTAVAVLEMHRNDYDVLYDEQYPGIALPNRFNTHLLDTSHQYLSPVVQTVEETTGVLPGEIKGALAIGMMLTIFACLIHRLLE